jgi:hypothetical protein
MEDRPFNNQNEKPADEDLKKILGDLYSQYQALEKLSASFKQEWNFSKSGGWHQKVYDQKKALYYLIPLYSAFKISLTVREEEREIFLKDHQLSEFLQQLTAAKKFIEGYVLQFMIADRDSFDSFSKLIMKIMECRGK